jgi:hypothetical protein
VVSYQHGGLWQQQFANRILVGVDLPLLPPGKVGHPGNQRDLGIVGGQFGNRADILGASGKTDLDDLHRRILEDGPRLLGDCLFLKGEEIEDPGGIADIGARDHRQGMTTDRCNGQDVTGHSTGTRRVAGIEHQNAGRRSILGGRRHGFRGGRRFRVCHEPESGRNSVSMAGISRLASIQ